MDFELIRIVSTDYIGQINAEVKDEDLGIYHCADTDEVIVLNSDGLTATVITK